MMNHVGRYLMVCFMVGLTLVFVCDTCDAKSSLCKQDPGNEGDPDELPTVSACAIWELLLDDCATDRQEEPLLLVVTPDAEEHHQLALVVPPRQRGIISEEGVWELNPNGQEG